MAGSLAGSTVEFGGDLEEPFRAVNAERIVGRKPAEMSHTEAAALPLTAITAWESLFDKLRIAPDATGTLLVVGGAGGVGSIAIQLVRTLLPGVRVIATASRPESEAWVRDLGAHEVVDHHGDLAAQVLEIAPDGIDWILTTNSTGQLPVYERVLRPFGQIVAIDDPEHLDVVALKSKALTWHWEFMFARSLHGAADVVEQHRILDEVADLVNAGRIRSTATTVLRPITAETLREAHRLVESGRVVGKVVVSDEPVARAADPPRPPPEKETTMSIILTQALRIIAAADAKAAELGVPSSITVLDDGARMVASVRQDGAPLVSIDSSFAKARTSVYFGGAATGDLAAAVQPGAPLYTLVAASNEPLACLAGGLPITDGSGALIGAVGSGGGTPEEDAVIAQAGIDAAQ